VAGVNKSLKAGTVVFKAGDNADGMYLVRKGELVVYLEQAGKEVTLAKIAEGGMVGEMALFDRMPRSASVKASIDSEITHITMDDFSKLMKQIPKWFVGLMTALSGRLRTTNDRLKSLETGANASSTPTSAPTNGPTNGQTATTSTAAAKPFQGVMRVMHVLELLWHRDGTKEGKDWMIQRKTAEDELTKVFGEDPAKVTALLDLLCSEGILLSKQDAYKNQVLSMPNRASLRQFGIFMAQFVAANPAMHAVPEPLMHMLRSLARMAQKAPYDQFTVTLEELMEDGKAAGVNSDGWAGHIRSFNSFGESAKPVKTSSKSGLGIRVIKVDLTTLMKNLNVYNKLSEKKLDQ
jgi:CRP-like cAMP-binding protein